MTRKIAKDDTPKKAEPRPETDLLEKKPPLPPPQGLAANLAWTMITQTMMTLTNVIVEEEGLVVVLAVSVFFQARLAFPKGGHAPSNYFFSYYNFSRQIGVRVTTTQLIGFASRQPPQVVLR